MRALGLWLLGTVYVLIVLAGMVAVVWAADHPDNSTDPTHWGLGSVVVLAPLTAVGLAKLVGPWTSEWARHRRWATLLGTTFAAGLGVALVVGAQSVVADASACGDDDCVTLAVPIGIACVLGAWSLPLGLSALQRLRYPAPLISVGMVATAVTLVAGTAAVVQASWQEDNYADLTPILVWLVWILPATLAIVAIVVLRSSIESAASRNAAGRMAARYLVGVGSWFMVLPLVAGVDSDSRPVLLAVSGGPGLVLLAVGLLAFVHGSAQNWSH